jgi:cytochrome c
MHNLEFNKIFAAILVAALTFMLAGFAAELLTKPQKLKQDAVAIEGAPEVAAGGAAAPAMAQPILAMIATADIAQGEKLSKACAACHSFDKGGVTKVGPNMWGIVNNKKGHVAGFAYSEGLLATGGNWNYLSLNKFLWSPKKYAPGTKMSYVGLKKPEDRAAMIAWLRTLADSPAALPSDAEIAAEMAELAPPPAAAPAEAAVPAAPPAAVPSAASEAPPAATEAPKTPESPAQ